MESSPQSQIHDHPNGFAYPPKPVAHGLTKGNPFLRFIISAGFFIAFYYFFISKNWEVIALLAGILFIHELGHYFAMRFFKYHDLSIFFLPLVGAAAGGTKEQISQKEKSIVVLAGPVPGIITGLILFYIAGQQENDFLLRLSYIFVLLNMFNLLPVYPLDGGQLLKTLFFTSREIISGIFIVLSVAATIWFAIVYKEWFLLIIPYFLVMRLVSQAQVIKLRKRLDELAINYHKSYSELTDAEYWQIRDELAVTNTYFGRMIASKQYALSKNEKAVINYIKSVLKTNPTKDLSVPGILVVLVIWLAAIAVPLLVMDRIWSIF